MCVHPVTPPAKGPTRATSGRISGVSLFMIVGLTGGCTEPELGRRILTNAWDTVLVLGSFRASDTALIRPAELLVSGNQLLVLEDLDQQVRAFDVNSGQREWTFGRKGEGPGEMLFANGMFFDPEGNLRIWDSRNRKLLTIDRQGSFLGEEYFRDRWGVSGRPTGFGEGMVWAQLSENRPVFLSGFTASEPLDSVDVDWPIPEDIPYRPSLGTKNAGSSGAWVQGLILGPYFAVGSNEEVTIHPYVAQVPYAYASWQRLRDHDPAADTARWGARDLAMTTEGIYVLTGGRPLKLAHPGPNEPSRFIDVYRLDGTYRHSYYLPLDSHRISTEDGRTFYVLNSPLLGFPQILGLRLKLGG